MANAGKYRDTCPKVFAAGLPGKTDESVANLFVKYSYEDHFDNLIELKANKLKKSDIHAKGRVVTPAYFENIKDLISPPPKTNFQNFYDKVYEAKYESRKNRSLAASRQCCSKPETITNENTTFGEATRMSDSLYDLILPPKIPFQVFNESEAGHDKYVLTHQHYFPAERVNRNYTSPPFDEKLTYGVQSKTEPGGKLVRRAMEDLWCPDYLCIMSSVQRNYLERHKSAIGKPLQPNKITSKLPPDHVFGVISRPDCYSGEELVYNREPYDLKIKLNKSLAYLNSLRQGLKNRMSYDMEDMRLEAEEMDSEFTGMLNLSALFCILKGHHIGVDEDKIRLLLDHFKMIEPNDKVNFKHFMNLLDTSHLIPDLGRLDDIYVGAPHTLTTYRDFTNDMYSEDLKCTVNAAGVPSQSMDTIYPKIHTGTVRADIESLSEETDVRSLLMPSVPTMFGLSYRDYCLPRSRDEIRTIFTNIGYDLADDCKFQELWCEALQYWTCLDHMVSTEAFRHVLKLREEKSKC